MSFLSSAFSGASNNFTPGGGSAKQAQYIASAQNNYGNADNGLNDLAAMLKQQAQGGGPNLANQQLARATAQNVGSQAALMAGQRGASANPALIARQAAMQGANIQQQAAGQSAENVLAQQLAAQSQLGGVLGTQGSLANQNYGITQGAITGNNQIGANIAGQNAQMNQGLIGGIAGAGSKLLGLADGGEIQPQQPMQSNWANSFVSMMKPQQQNIPIQNVVPNPGMEQAQQSMRKAFHFAQGGMALPFMPMDLKQGGEVKARAPEEKAIKPGNNYANDKIPAMVSEGEVVLPREIAMSPDAPAKAAQFMSQVMAGKHRARK